MENIHISLFRNLSDKSPLNITLSEFLQLGKQHLNTIDQLRSCTEKAARDRIKRSQLPAATISAVLSTRESSQPLEKRIICYNPLLTLDFDNLPDIEEAKRILATLPYIYYAGLSVSGRGLFAIIPIAAQDHTQHKTYFHALEKEMQTLGLTIDKACKDVTRLRVVSYDENPYINPGCIIYTLPEAPDATEDPEAEEAPETQEEDFTALKLEEHISIWEEKQHPLDEYDQWITVGMALSRLGEDATGKGTLRDKPWDRPVLSAVLVGAMLLVIVLLGIYGPGYDASQFIYDQF